MSMATVEHAARDYELIHRRSIPDRLARVDRLLARTRSYSLMANDPPVISAIDNLTQAVEELRACIAA